MLRAGSAAVLVAAAITLTVAGLWPFAAMIAAGSVILAWEWGRLVRGKAPDAAFHAHAVGAAAACGLMAWGLPLTAFAALFAGAACAALLASGEHNRSWSATGVLYLGLAALLFVKLRSDALFGLWAVIFLFFIVWSADTAAYFVGRTFRGPKLAPAISPGKTWSGFIGGLAVPALMAYGYALWLGGTSALKLALAGTALALACEVGDLAESAIKRSFRVKDSGQILPGHGGLFDRVDGLIGALLAAGVMVAARDWSNPGRALLIWP